MNKLRLCVALLVIVSALAAGGCQGPGRSGVSYERITCDEVMAIAESYANHRWTPTQRNMFHGLDPDGVRVETCDANYVASRNREGGWVPGEVNVGIPYQWGGYVTVEEFDAGIRAGKFAGDIYYAKGQVTSKHAVGVDCSAFVSRCLRLPRQYSTRTLAGVCAPLKDPRELRRGDILNKYNGHVVLFHEFIDASKSRFRCYESTGSKVSATERDLDEMLQDGYRALRYKYIVD